MDTIEEKKKKRLLLLKELYDKSDGSSTKGVIRDSLENYDPDIMSYLSEEGLVKDGKRTAPNFGKVHYSITHQGIKEIEQARDNPTQPTEHLTSYINNFNAPVNNLAMQQGAHNSSQTFSITEKNSEDLEKVFNELNKAKEQLAKESDSRRELEAHIATLQAQISSPKPSHTVVSTVLSEVKSFLLGVNVNLYTPVLKETIKRLIE